MNKNNDLIIYLVKLCTSSAANVAGVVVVDLAKILFRPPGFRSKRFARFGASSFDVATFTIIEKNKNMYNLKIIKKKT